MYMFPLCKYPVTIAGVLFEWHFCYVAACLQHKLSSTEEKLFLCLRDSNSAHTLGHSPLRVLICYPTCTYKGVCVRHNEFVESGST